MWKLLLIIFSFGFVACSESESSIFSFIFSSSFLFTVGIVLFVYFSWINFFAPSNQNASSLFRTNSNTQNSGLKSDEYANFFDESSGDKSEQRKASYATVVNHYYDLATDFYEWGWGECFHFAPRYAGETPKASFARHEHKLALALKLKKGMKVLDVGCGVGGPMREIARFTGANIIGINNNAYQVSRAKLQNKTYGLDKLCDVIKGDFMKIPFDDNTFDAIYAIEATCHAPSKVAIYSEIKRVLKPGGEFACYEWCMTDKYDPNNSEHKAIKLGIESGNGIPNLDTTQVVVEALKQSGYEILEYEDVAVPSDQFPVPWYHDFVPGFTISGFKLTRPGRIVTNFFVSILEFIRLAPPGSAKLQRTLIHTADALTVGGQKQVFTPAFFFHVRKPSK